VDLEEAVIKSCNIFFYHLSRELDYDLMFRWAEMFGFGERTGFLDPKLYDAVFAESGVREDPGYLKRHETGTANLMRFCIGQGAIDDVTPLQIARMISGVATGHLPRPYMIMQIGDRPVPVPQRRKLPIAPETFAAVRDAMRQVTLTGTADPDPGRELDLTPYRIAGKTGTAQVAAGPSHAWFAGYMPHERPALAFAVFVESCGLHGGEAAAPLLQRILEQEETADLLRRILE
jgi:penicillin-binding protein 2